MEEKENNVCVSMHGSLFYRRNINKGEEAEEEKREDYLDYSFPLRKISPHKPCQ